MLRDAAITVLKYGNDVQIVDEVNTLICLAGQHSISQNDRPYYLLHLQARNKLSQSLRGQSQEMPLLDLLPYLVKDCSLVAKYSSWLSQFSDQFEFCDFLSALTPGVVGECLDLV